MASSFAYLAEHGNTKQFRIASRFVVFLVLFIPAAFRYNTGTDYQSYVAMFNGTSRLRHIEGPYLYLNQLIRSLGLSVQWVFVFCGIVIYFPICFILKRKYYFFAILFYILLFFYLRSYNTMRQAMAISLLISGLIYLDDKKYFKFIVFMTFAILIHVSALFVLPLLLLRFFRFNKKIFPVLITLFGMIILYNIDILSILFTVLKIINSSYYRYGVYLEKGTFHLEGGTIFTLLATMVRSSMLFFAVYFYSDIAKKNRNVVFLLNMSIIYNYVNIVALRYRIIARIRELFMWVPVLVSGYAFQPLKKYKKVVMYIIILLNISLFEFTIQQNNRERIGASIYPYYSIFSKDK